MNYPIEKFDVYTLNVGYSCNNADWNWKNIQSPFARLYLVLNGKAKIVLPDGTYELTPGHLYLIPAYTRHSYICTSHFSHYYLHIYEKQTCETSILEEFNMPVEVEAEEYDMKLFEKLVHLNPFMKLPSSNPNSYDNHQTLVNNMQMNVKRPFFEKVESRGILFILLSRFLKNASPKVEVSDDRIRQALALIRHNLNKHLDIATIANEVCMSKDHFIRTFKKEVGTTPNTYIIRRKMEMAQLLLLTSDNPVKSIAAQLGFTDDSYFNRAFSNLSGNFPANVCICYRKRLRLIRGRETTWFFCGLPSFLHPHALFPPRVGIMSSMERRQASRRDTNVQDQPACVEMSPMTVLARMAVPKKYPKKPVRPAAVPAAFLGTRSRACTPTSMTGP